MDHMLSQARSLRNCQVALALVVRCCINILTRIEATCLILWLIRKNCRTRLVAPACEDAQDKGVDLTYISWFGSLLEIIIGVIPEMSLADLTSWFFRFLWTLEPEQARVHLGTALGDSWI